MSQSNEVGSARQVVGSARQVADDPRGCSTSARGLAPNRSRLTAALLALLASSLLLPLATSSSAQAASSSVTVVEHGTTFTAYFPDDICGPRAATTTLTRRVEQIHLTRRADGSFSYHDVGVFTYKSDYVDPALPDLTGRGTEVNHYVLTPGGNFLATTTFHDFLGDIQIHVRIHLTVLADGTATVDRDVLSVTGCP